MANSGTHEGYEAVDRARSKLGKNVVAASFVSYFLTSAKVRLKCFHYADKDAAAA